MSVLGIGVDLVDVQRVRTAIERNPRFRERVFSPEEIESCEASSRPEECYASRWAAREACVKALGGSGGWGWQDVRVLVGPDGAPMLELAGKALARAGEIGASGVLVSLSHEGGMAVAVCVALGPAAGT